MSKGPITLGEIADVSWGNTSITKASYIEKGVTAFSASGPDGFLPEAEHNGIGIVLSAIGAKCGKCFFANGQWTAIKNTITILPKEDVNYDFNFLFHYLNRETVWPKRGGGQPFIALGAARELVVPDIPVNQQKYITKRLDVASSLIEKRDETIALLDNYLRSLFIEMFGDPASNPKEFDVKSLEQILKVTSGKFLPAKEQVSSGGHSVYGGNGINGYHNEYMFSEPRIVIGRVGVYCGVVHRTLPESWVTDNALIVEKTDRGISDDYLEWALRFLNLNAVSSQSAQPLISGSRIYPLKIVIPPKSLQEKFSQELTKISELQAKLQTSKTDLDNLFNSLLAESFSGEH